MRKTIRIIDSHTGGEPTRVVLEGGLPLSGLTMAQAKQRFDADGHWLRGACIAEPRGFDAIVGALLCESLREDCVAGVVFFNNVSSLNGCIHGTIGLTVTLAHLGRIGPGIHRIETPSGVVTVTLFEHGKVRVENVRSYRLAAGTTVEVPHFGTVAGDIAWGGNWFFLVESPRPGWIRPENIGELDRFARSVRSALDEAGITGTDGAIIDHVEIFDASPDPSTADSRNFVLCPGGAYDRSPCGTGTSAKLACLHAEGKLKEGDTWHQAGILGSIFEGRVRAHPSGGIIPTITGSAFITAETVLVLDPDDPFAYGIHSQVG